jgi:hypothetical protein
MNDCKHMKAPIPRYCALLITSLMAVLLPACAHSQHGDQVYEPRVGQHGKDVIWVPTPDDLVVKMLETAKVTSRDLVVDLGAGDGKIPIQAARQFGAHAIGIEYNKDLAELARRNAQRAGVADKVKIIHGDIFKEDFSQATVVTLYLLPELNMKLKPTLLKMKPGTRIVSHSFNMETWEPDAVISGANSYYGYFWMVPAPIDGRWTISGLNGAESIDIRQRFQKFGGFITINGRREPITEGVIRGPEVTLKFRDSQLIEHTIVATAQAGQLTGKLFVQGQAITRDIQATRDASSR